MNSVNSEQSKIFKPLMYIIWFAIVLAVLSIGYGYIGWRLISTTRLNSPWGIMAWTGLAVLFVLPIVSSLLMRHDEKLSAPFSWISYIGLGFLSFVFTLLMSRDFIWLLWLGLQKGYFLSQGFLSAAGVKTQPGPSPGEFLLHISNLAVLGVSVLLTSYGIYEARRKPRVVRITVPIHGLPSDFEGFKIVQITDIHAGLTVKRNWVETIVREVQVLRPDLIAFTGDLADGTVPHLAADVAPLGNLQAPYGKFFVTGNHEYYSGVEPWLAEVGRLGYEVLINDHRLISCNGSSLVLAGVTDSSGGQFLPGHRSDPQAAVRSAPAGRVKILLAHQPRTLYKTDPLDFDLIISGHTHGGQFFPWNYVASIGQPYISGLHNHHGTWIYVSKGTGYWGPPVRLGARSEITVITLQQGTNHKT
jgi:predicted MPP superfamily phosphohydrolase